MGRRVRITGLVRLANNIRQELISPSSAAQLERCRAKVEKALAKVQEMLARSGASERALPPPTRRALEFLRGIPWHDLPLHQGEAPIVRARLPALGGYVLRLLDVLGGPQDAEQLQELRRALEKKAGTLAQLLTWRRFAFSKNDRAHLILITFLAARGNLERYRKAAAEVSDIMSGIAPGNYLPISIHFRPVALIYKLEVRHAGSRLFFPLGMMMHFDHATWLRMARFIFRKDRSERPSIVQAMQTDAYKGFTIELNRLADDAGQTPGAFHDLSQAFNRVNASYFDGLMARPQLVWGSRLSSRKFGHFDYATDTLMVSNALDQAQVPQFTIDFLVYHELLHKKHGTRWKNGRGYAHTAAFYADEARFTDRDRAEEILKQIAQGTWRPQVPTRAVGPRVLPAHQRRSNT